MRATGRLAVTAALAIASAAWGGDNAPDERLARKVSYSGACKRLHDVVSGVSAKTRVIIRTGSSESDWQVRDRPVSVYASDLPLGTLMTCLADACRLDMSSTTVKDEKAYRLFISSTRAGELDALLERERKWAADSAEWVWDSLVKAAGMPVSSFTADPGQVSQIRAMGRFLASLEPDIKKKVLAGEPVMIREKWQAAMAELMSDSSLRSPDPELSVERMKKSSIVLWLTERDDGVSPGLRTQWIFDDGTAFSMGPGMLSGVGQSWYGESGVISEPPDAPGLPVEKIRKGLVRLEDDPSYRAFLGTAYGDKPAVAKWSLPLLNKRVKLDLPKDGYQFSDVLAALSRAGGVAIVCEDFFTRASDSQLKRAGCMVLTDQDKALRAESTLGEKLVSLGCCGVQWLVDARSGVLIGRPVFYVPRHVNMLPQTFLDDLIARANGRGLELEEVLAIEQCTPGQVEESVSGLPEMANLGAQSFSEIYGLEAALWKLYARLSPADRARAKSASGLPLMKLDAAWLKDFFTQEGPQGLAIYTRSHGSRFDSATIDIFRKLTDTANYPRLTLFLRRQESEPAAGVPRHRYQVSIEGEIVKDSCRATIDRLPIYSPRREEELRKCAAPDGGARK